MPLNNPAILHVDKYLTNLSLEVPQDGFVAEAIMPSFPVSKVTDLYLDWTPASTHRLYDNEVTKWEDPKYIHYDAVQRSYRSRPYALGDLISKEDVDNADPPISLMADSARFLENAMRLAREARVLSQAFAPVVPRIVAGALWSAVGGTPVADVRRCMVQIQRLTQTQANSIVIPVEVAIQMIGTTEWLAYFAGTDRGFDSGLFKMATGMEKLGLTVYLAGVCALETDQNTASDPDVFSRMIGRNVFVFNRKPRPTLRTRCFGFSPTFYGREVTKDFLNRKRAWEVFSREHMDELLIDANAGCWITGV